jgi:hypothetical protein
VKKKKSIRPIVLAYNKVTNMYIEAVSAANHTSLSMEELVALLGLSNKTFHHCDAGLILVKKKFMGEARILFRAAFEAAILFYYYTREQTEIKHFISYSKLLQYKDCLLSAKYSPDQELRFGDKETLKTELLDNPILAKLNLKNGHLDNVEVLKRVRTYPTIHKIIETFDERGQYWCEGLSYLIYNFGSQVVHSSWETVTQHYVADLYDPVGSEYVSIPNLYLQAICMIEILIHGSHNLGWLKVPDYILLYYLDKVRDKIVEWCEEEWDLSFIDHLERY